MNREALVAEWVRRFGQRSAIPQMRAGLHAKQLAFVTDPSKRKALLEGRRTGKSYGLAEYCVENAMIYPGLTIPFLALSRGAAKRILWSTLNKLNYKHQLGIRFNSTDATATLPNEGKIWLAGANEEEDIAKVRGDAGGYPLAVTDETGSMVRHLRTLIVEILDPALSDRDGTIVLSGTPGIQAKGVFYEATTGRTPGWSVHRGTVLDNPLLPLWAGMPNWKELAQRFLDDKRAKYGWALDNPIFLREWMGEWVASDAGLVYRFDASRNVYAPGELEGRKMDYVLGVDLGFDDESAFVVLGFSDDSPNLYEIETTHARGLIASQMMDRVRMLEDKYHFLKIVCDTGGLAKSIAEELRQRHSLPIEAAEKTRKAEYIAIFNGDMQSGRIRVLADSPVIEQWQNIRWADEDDALDDDDELVVRKIGGVGKKHIEDPRDPNDRADAFTYAHRECQHWMYTVPPAPKPHRGTPEHLALLEQQFMAQAFEEVAAKQRAARGEGDDSYVN